MIIVWSGYRTYHLEAFADGRLCKLRRFGGAIAPLSPSASTTRLTFLALSLGLLCASSATQAGLPGLVECSMRVKGFRGVGDGGCCEGEQALGVEGQGVMLVKFVIFF